MIELTEHAEGMILCVRASAGARENGVRGEHRGAVKVSVTQAPEKGKANDAIALVLAAAIGVKKSQVELIAGAASRDKKYLIRGATRESLSPAIQAAIGGK